jgi:hypothetical protein
MVVSVNSNLWDAQWRILDQLHGENYACQDYIDREIMRHAQNDHSDDRLLATFHNARGKKTATWKFMVGAKKNSASELKVGKHFFLLDFGNRRSANP